MVLSPFSLLSCYALFSLTLFVFLSSFRGGPSSLSQTRKLAELALLLAFVIVLFAFAFAFAFALVYLVQCVQLRPGFISCRYPLAKRNHKRF